MYLCMQRESGVVMISEAILEPLERWRSLVRFGDRAAWLGFLRWALPRSLSQEADDEGAEFTTPAALSGPLLQRGCVITEFGAGICFTEPYGTS